MKKQYFKPEFIEFFKSLRANNNKDWFDSHKKEYIEKVKDPFEKFITDALEVLSQYEADVMVKAKDCIFRIHRDLRFSADKTPYKVSCSALLSPMGRKGHSDAAYYIELTDKTAWIVGGVYNIDPKNMVGIRAYIHQHYKEFLSIINDPQFVNEFGKIKGEESRKLVGEFKDMEKEFPLLLKKQFYFSKDLESKDILGEHLMDTVHQLIKIGQPFNQFFKRAFKAL